MKQRSTVLLTVTAFGYAFLYLPIVSVIFYSSYVGLAGCCL